MNKKALLDALHNESVLLEAKARGALQAYHNERMHQAAVECGYLGLGDVVLIKYESGDAKAEISKMFYSLYDFDKYEGPAFSGRLFLKSGKKAKHAKPLFTLDQWRAKLVLRA